MNRPKREFGFVLALAGVLLLCVLTIHKGQIAGDGILRYEALRTLMEDGRLTADKYSILMPLAATPLYVLGSASDRIRGGDQVPASSKRWVRRFNGLIAAVIALGFFLYLRRVLRWSRGSAVSGTALLIFGSMLLPHARDFYSETLWTFGSALALWLLASIPSVPETSPWRFRSLTLVLLLALLVPVNPILVLVFLSLAAIMTAAWAFSPASAGERPALPIAPLLIVLGVACGTALCGAENLLRRGSLTDFGYPGEGFSTPFLHGLMGQFLAPGRGIVFFAPAVFAGLWLVSDRRPDQDPRHRAFIRLSLLFCALLVLAYAKWHAWHGAWYWGPRFLLPLSVFGALYLAVLIRDRWGTSGPAARFAWGTLAALSVGVFIVGATVNQDQLIECLRLSPSGEACYWDPRFIPLASWIDRSDLIGMLNNRSSPVIAGTVVLLAALVKWWPDASGD